MRIIDKLQDNLRAAAEYNPEVQVAPACILWPDKERQWEAVIPRVQAEMPELFVLGEYAPDKRIGPGIWLRCVIANTLETVKLPEDKTPVIYMPGVGRQDLRAVESCPDYLKPIVELQYRGVIWSQVNAKDWTILAFLKSSQGGLGLDVAQDKATLNAMQIALNQFLDEDYDLLVSRRLDEDYFNNLLTGGDPIKELLQWLDQGESFRKNMGENEWQAFVSLCISQLGFNPDKQGLVAGAKKLAERKGQWQPVWDRFCEAPQRYPNIPNRLRKIEMQIEFFANELTHGGWPQWNDIQESRLKNELAGLNLHNPSEARKYILDLEKKHGSRRKSVWAEFDDTPLADSLKWLAKLAEQTQNALAGGDIEDIMAGYMYSGWRADDAVLRALESVRDQGSYKAVAIAIRAVYMPWLEESNQYFQQKAEEEGYPAYTNPKKEQIKFEKGECLFFVDGLRYDIAQRLISQLENKGYGVESFQRWSALPSVTATAKPAVSPVQHRIVGKEPGADFEPVVADTGQSLKGGYHLKKLLQNEGWAILDKNEQGVDSDMAWCECGDIDNEGHKSGWKIVRYIPHILSELIEQIERLLYTGWIKIHVVTDHGWLLMPDGLPKVNLPSALSENKWGRCAVLKQGAKSKEKQFPWYWNENHFVTLASGISSYREGMEYSHGGLSLQECLLLDLTVTSKGIKKAGRSIEITDIIWRGLRCKFAIDGDYEGLHVDIRKQAGDPNSSVVMEQKSKPVDKSGKGSVMVEDDTLEDEDAYIVIINETGDLIAQAQTIIGGKD